MPERHLNLFAFAGAAALGFVATAVAMNPSRRTFTTASIVALLALIALATLLLDANRAAVGRWPLLASLAAALQALFFAAFITAALFAYVVKTPRLLSGFVVLNLAGLLFWRFRRRYLDAADEAAAEEAGLS